mmetsp:Transcript_12432/g.22611  ORF Transcript_12432/g.22611 Transcript_12432/m.22611 type:complete len:219 (-) Transcript_12432:24-680(-)
MAYISSVLAAFNKVPVEPLKESNTSPNWDLGTFPSMSLTSQKVGNCVLIASAFSRAAVFFRASSKLGTVHGVASAFLPAAAIMAKVSSGATTGLRNFMSNAPQAVKIIPKDAAPTQEMPLGALAAFGKRAAGNCSIEPSNGCTSAIAAVCIRALASYGKAETLVATGFTRTLVAGAVYRVEAEVTLYAAPRQAPAETANKTAATNLLLSLPILSGVWW